MAQTKPGLHGTLYLYHVPYTADSTGTYNSIWRCWAYDAEHAALKFDESEVDGGFVRTGWPKLAK